jgi:hypothetical protein
MRRIFASTLLALGLTGGVAAASPWHHEGYGRATYRDPRIGAFHRGFDRGFDRGYRGGERRDARRDWRFDHRGRR